MLDGSVALRTYDYVSGNIRYMSIEIEPPPAKKVLPKLAYDRCDSAVILGMSPASLDRLVKRGLIRPSRALHKPMFALTELERFLRETVGDV